MEKDQKDKKADRIMLKIRLAGIILTNAITKTILHLQPLKNPKKKTKKWGDKPSTNSINPRGNKNPP